ncbi:MAG: molybdenum cofactor biosynthesis protein MoaE [Pseudomonadota bacterium]|nr:molybdenum cofactor biosynthesis protein MoaE [Pseudomonadota bacterium]
MDKIVVQTEDFDLTTEVEFIKSSSPNVGAIVSFIGTVRDLNNESLVSLTLEHYPEMTEKSLESIANKARNKWELESITIIHRVGTLCIGDQIVLVITTSEHRQEAFDSCNFIMDYLKTDAPFWKKEISDKEDKWVEIRETDEKQKSRWKR